MPILIHSALRSVRHECESAMRHRATRRAHSSDRRRTFTRSDDGFARFAVVRQRSRPCHAGLTRLGLEGSRRMLHRPRTGSCDKAFRACFP